MDRERGSTRHSAEYAGRTVEEAVETASRDLGIPAGELEYQVLSDSTRSFLGLVRTGEVRVRVSWLAKAAAPERQASEPPVQPVSDEAAEAQMRAAESAPTGKQGAAPEPDEAEEDEDAPVYKQNPPELLDVAQDVLTTLLDKIGVLAAVEVVDRGGKLDEASEEVSPLILNVVGDDLGALIGRRGETLRDLQFMTRLITSRRIGTWPNLVVDVEGYKTRREDSLRSLARRVADQVRRSGQAMALEPMPAHERRIVHLALRDDPDVYTESTGKDERRKVQILPK
jgi:spoIIIJ-associated protein